MEQNRYAPFKPDTSNPLWEKFEKYLEGELQKAYSKMSSLTCPPAETDQLRGRAAFIKQLLDLKVVPTNITGPDSTMEY